MVIIHCLSLEPNEDHVHMFFHSRLLLCGAAFVLACGVPCATAQAAPAAPRPQRTAAELYKAACATCHGPDGRGAPLSQVAFDAPLPDFTDCGFATPEPDPDWSAVVHLGGTARALDHRMPAFIDALTTEEIELAISHVRAFCTEKGWPRGELNLPRPLVTEKAYPENEAVLTVKMATSHPHSVENEFLYEHRIGRRGQYEVIVPVNLQQGGTGGSRWTRGLGDLAVAYKHVLYDSLDRGSIFSLGTEFIFPTGKELEGLGGGKKVFETFAAYGQMLPNDAFFQFHGGFEFPVKAEDSAKEAFWRLTVGKTWAQNRGFGRAWSPMVELVAAKELVRGEDPQWDAVPQMQVSLSGLQHVLFNVGLRIPVNEREGRSKTFMVYLLWDWFDGGLFDNW
ncbi:MAG: cytochrome c [Vicinamibacterales bacterium]